MPFTIEQIEFTTEYIANLIKFDSPQRKEWFKERLTTAISQSIKVNLQSKIILAPTSLEFRDFFQQLKGKYIQYPTNLTIYLYSDGKSVRREKDGSKKEIYSPQQQAVTTPKTELASGMDYLLSKLKMLSVAVDEKVGSGERSLAAVNDVLDQGEASLLAFAAYKEPGAKLTSYPSDDEEYLDHTDQPPKSTSVKC